MAGNPLLPAGILRFALVSSPCHALGKGVEAGLIPEYVANGKSRILTLACLPTCRLWQWMAR
jgi:hypothetical protein